MFREKLGEIYAHKLEWPREEFLSPEQHVLRAAAATIGRYEIPQSLFLDFANALAKNATIRRYPTWNSLEKYCSLTAGSVAQMMGCVFGLTHSEAGKQLQSLGVAMRLTYLLRDLSSDHQRGRVYLPLEDMARAGYSERDLAASRVNDGLKRLLEIEMDRARALYRSGAEAICWLAGDGSKLTASTIAVFAAGLLWTIERRKYDPFSHRVELSWDQRLRLMPAAWRLARRSANAKVPEVF